jgi:hypothetical protein
MVSPLGQQLPALPRAWTASLSGPQKVIVRGSGAEIHGYAVEVDGERVLVVWEVASGRSRRRSVPAQDVFLPSFACPWTGLAISPDQLRARSRGAG